MENSVEVDQDALVRLRRNNLALVAFAKVRGERELRIICDTLRQESAFRCLANKDYDAFVKLCESLSCTNLQPTQKLKKGQCVFIIKGTLGSCNTYLTSQGLFSLTGVTEKKPTEASAIYQPGSLIVCHDNSTTALQPTMLLILTAKQVSILKEAKRQHEERKRLNFLSQNPLISDLPRSVLQRLASLASEQIFTYKTFIFQQSTPINRIYFIVNGECQLERWVPVSNNNTSDLNRIVNRESAKITFRRVSCGQMICDESIYTRTPLHTYSCVGISTVIETLWIDLHAFLDSLKGNDGLAARIESRLKAKYLAEQMQIQSILQRYNPKSNSMISRYLSRQRQRPQSAGASTGVDPMLEKGIRSFAQFNATLMREQNLKRISHYRRSSSSICSRAHTPSTISDIVEVIAIKEKFLRTRNHKGSNSLFEFSREKVPLHIRKKYDRLSR